MKSFFQLLACLLLLTGMTQQAKIELAPSAA